MSIHRTVNLQCSASTRHQVQRYRGLLLGILLCLYLCAGCHAEVFKLGYLTGSQRRPGNLDYQRPGITISGAISLAVAQVNAGRLGTLGHSLEFVVAETYGDEVASIRQTAALWTQQVAAYIGPQETCVHEGRMAAAFNLPMISYYCTHRDPSNKLDFPTFARTRPPDTQISKSVVALLLAFNWTQVSFLYLDDVSSQYQPVAETILSTLVSAGVSVRDIRTWNTIYHHGFMANPFDALVEQTHANTRIYLVLGHYYEHVGLMVSLQQRGLLSQGEYFVVGIDIEQYDPAKPEKYLRGMLMEKVEPLAAQAFQSYLGIVPTAPISFATFANEVNKYMERPPFNFPNPLGLFGGAKQISAEAAYLYDAVHLYANSLLTVLDSAGTFSRRSNNINSSDALPDLNLYRNIDWVAGVRPAAAPKCGFGGEKCVNYTGEISAGIAGGALLLLGLVSLVLYRNWRYEQELDSLLWKIDFREVQVHENEKEQQSQKPTRVSCWKMPVTIGLCSND
ncbi:GH24616 [Drosophila grimshawi]|uniref:GH24616 n=1 Tax=Drosophila grimshawi TaxID=7222 RepID=B4K1D4_DROGR|nr:GH24616 [Drosophila grimshawi]